MSKELVRFKYKKDIINCIEESWDYYGKEDEMREVIKELKNVYKIASSAKNAPKSETEKKATAFDEIFKLYIGYEDGWINYPRGKMSFNKAIINVCRDYESGESE